MLLISEDDELPVSLEQIKDYLHIDFDIDDTQLTRCLRAGTNYVEYATDRDFIERTYKQHFHCITTRITFDRSPLQYVNAFTYLDGDGVRQDFEDYEVWTTPLARPRIVVSCTDIPAVATEVEITYSTGLNAVSPVVEQAILWASSHFYLNRETEVIGTITSPLKTGLDRIINQIKAGGYF